MQLEDINTDINSENALLRRSQVLALGGPSHSNFKAFKNWFYYKIPLRGSGFHLLDDEDDMASLHNDKEPDLLSTFIHYYFGYYLRIERKTPRSWGPIYYYPTERIAWIVAILSVLISAALLIGAIMALFWVKPMTQRLWIVGAFTLVFAAMIGLLTNARRAEVSAATAAYARSLVWNHTLLTIHTAMRPFLLSSSVSIIEGSVPTRV
jgi:hypothetical protein